MSKYSAFIGSRYFISIRRVLLNSNKSILEARIPFFSSSYYPCHLSCGLWYYRSCEGHCMYIFSRQIFYLFLFPVMQQFIVLLANVRQSC